MPTTMAATNNTASLPPDKIDEFETVLTNQCILYPVYFREIRTMAKLNDAVKKKALRARLARIEGQLRGVQRQIELDADCEAVAQQLSAARKALDKAFFTMVGCVIEQGDVPAHKVATLLAKFA